MSTKRQSRYWICMGCALKLKFLPPDHPVTCISGLCGHCDSVIEQTLIPVIDFKGGDNEPVFD